MKEKELMEFVKDLYDRGLLIYSPNMFDYEKVIWDYLRKPIDQIVERTLPDEYGPPRPPLSRLVEGHGL